MQKKSVILLLVIQFLFFLNKNSHAQVPLEDSLALVDLYNSTNGSNWNNRTEKWTPKTGQCFK